MEIVRQPPGSNLCGVAATAMLSNKSLREAMELFLPEAATDGVDDTEIRAALNVLGWRMSNRHFVLSGLSNEEKFKRLCTGRFNALLSNPDRYERAGHWMVWDRDGQRVIDPNFERENRIQNQYQQLAYGYWIRPNAHEDL